LVLEVERRGVRQLVPAPAVAAKLLGGRGTARISRDLVRLMPEPGGLPSPAWLPVPAALRVGGRP
jgi:hypothetical protein